MFIDIVSFLFSKRKIVPIIILSETKIRFTLVNAVFKGSGIVTVDSELSLTFVGTKRKDNKY
jgi:hypothetical protein